MHQSAARATITKTILLPAVSCPPKIQPTISNPNSPMEPQFNPPIMRMIRAVLSNMISPFQA